MKKRTFLLFLSVFYTILCSAQKESDILDTTYRNLTVVQADSLITAYAANPDFVIIDVRTAGEYNAGHLINAINMNYYAADFSAQLDSLDHSKAYLIYCQGGSRSGATFTMMQNKNFLEVYNMLGGINAWLGAGYPTTTTTSLDDLAIMDGSTISIWPNPTHELLQLSTGTSDALSFQVIGSDGRMIVDFQNPGSAMTIDVSGWKSGLYFVRVNFANQVQGGKVWIY